MKGVEYIQSQACLDGVPLRSIAEKFGTPCYVYSRASIEKNYSRFNQALKNIMQLKQSYMICYAVKANSNIAVLNVLSQMGSGFDIVSLGELEHVLAAGGDAAKVIFSGVGKQDIELETALANNIYCFNVESESELEQLQHLAQKHKKIASIALRINPDIDALTHPYIATGLKENKFGIDLKALKTLRQNLKKMPNLKLIGLACHIGSQIIKIEPFLEALKCLHKLYKDFSADGFAIQHINVGGGYGVRYRHENPPSALDFAAAIKKQFSACPLKIILEPGRSIMADAGLLLTQVQLLKETPEKNFAILDAGMNDLLRPALYQAWHDIIPLQVRQTEVKSYDLVGPICESADFLGRNRRLRLEKNDLLAILMAGAYGFSMSSNYNSRPRPAEVMIEDNKVNLIRRRETLKDLLSLQKIPGKSSRKTAAVEA